MKVDELYAEILATTGSMNSPDTEQIFLMSLKKVVNDLNRRLKEHVIAPEYISPAEIGFPEYCDNVYHPGVKFYMQRDGGWAQDPDTESYSFYEQQLRRVIGYAISEDTDFPTRNQPASD